MLLTVLIDELSIIRQLWKDMSHASQDCIDLLTEITSMEINKLNYSIKCTSYKYKCNLSETKSSMHGAQKHQLIINNLTHSSL